MTDIEYGSKWTVFGPFRKTDGDPAANDLRRVPTTLTLNGTTLPPRQVTQPGRLDLRSFVDEIKTQPAMVVYQEITAERDGEALIGFGADWFYRAWLDGKPVSDTLGNGNGRSPVTCADHVARVSLTAGKHLLAVRILSGSGGFMLTVGDPRPILKEREAAFASLQADTAKRLAALSDAMPPSRTVTIPGVREPIALGLTEAQRRLRKQCLVYQLAEPLRQAKLPGIGPIPELILIDARTWERHTDDEPWALWRGRLFAARMREMPLSLDAGEHVLGKPFVREATPAEIEQTEQARNVFATMPVQPGGDIGHFHPDFQTVLTLGIGGLVDRIGKLRNSASLDSAQRRFYEAADVAMRGFSDFVGRMATACEEKARALPAEREHWQEMAGICSRIAWDAPRSFHEALQLLHFVLFAGWYGEGHTQTGFGRMDQTLYPFYCRDLEGGSITPQRAFELLCDAFIQINRMQPPGGAIPVMVGGRDAEGRDLTNELTYLCLAVREATRLVYPTVGVAWHEKTPRALMDFGMRTLASGVGDPAFFNDEVISTGLQAHGVTPADSHNFMNSTCVEIKTVGNSNIWVASPYFNCPAYLLEAMRAAADERDEPASFGEFCRRVRVRIAAAVQAAAQSLDETWRRRARFGMQPFASCLIGDCLDRGRDIDQGGTRYGWVENSFVGLANLVDSLVVIKELVYERKELTLAKFHQILLADYRGHEAFRARVANTLGKYGNNLEAVDAMAGEWAKFLMDTSEACTVGGHRFVPGFFCWVMHEKFGSETCATPDGRRAGLPMADGAGPAQGRERSGPTSAVLSTTSWSHLRALGGLVHNLKFSKSMLASEDGREKVRAVIETYLKRGGFEIQVNVINADVLKEAQCHPEQYTDLLVRVAGYSDYFTHLNRNTQDEVIARTEFGACSN